MKYNKLLKKEVLSLLLAGSLVFTGMPAWATDSVDGNTAWEDSNESGTETDQQDTFASADSADASDGFSDAEDIQAPDGDDGFSDGEAEEQTSGFSSLDSGDPSPEDDNSIEENGLTDEEIEAQLEPIRELELLSYVDPPSGNGNGDTGSVGAARAASYPARYDPRSSLSLPVRNQKPSNMCWAYTLAANLEISFKRAGAGLFDLSEEHLAYFFANRKNDPLGNTANDRNEVQHSYREGGNQTLAAIFLSTWSGMALESRSPMRPMQTTHWILRKYQIPAWHTKQRHTWKMLHFPLTL